MRAIILAGGKGSRLRPYTNLIPKPLVPVGNKKAILEIIIDQLSKSGFNHVTITINHFSKLIQSYFGTGKKFNLRIDYTEEKKTLGTFAPLLLVKDLPNNFLVLNGDTLTNLNYKKFLKNHIKSKAEVTVGSTKRVEKLNYGILKFKNNKLLNFKEKPNMEMYVGIGIYALNKKVLNTYYKKQIRKIDFNEFLENRIKLKKITKIYDFKGSWFDIGNKKDYEFVNNNLNFIRSKIKYI